MIGMQITAFERGNLVLGRTQFKKELSLRSGSSDLNQRPGTQNIVLDGGLDPPHRICRKTNIPFGFKAVQRLHQADIPFGDNLRHGQTVAAVTHRYFCSQPQMAFDKLVGCFAITLLAPAFGELILMVPLENRETTNVRQVVLAGAAAGKL